MTLPTVSTSPRASTEVAVLTGDDPTMTNSDFSTRSSHFTSYSPGAVSNWFHPFGCVCASHK